ncbi:hypothetical protein K2173_026882 [Erythroxylum novogranatense]|uniref:Myb-like domain-containing protein n=1 Tax=Erythroxylum novogranatense TaxID=1862640 RepID=A0AAV8U0V5_9ROSI|nr:hypothetical protein K2173_026882 [Erythroxylum novogranatense]
MPATSGDVAETRTVRDNEVGEDEKRLRIIGEGDRLNYGANRWPRQETSALLKIRSDMDAVFRDSTHKGPLWEEVSRKLTELGYSRSAKKCKEKFENVYKYHKRTKGGRTGKSEGKTYRFFDQLQAFESHNSPLSSSTAALPSWVSPPDASHVIIPVTTTPMSVICQNTVTPTTNPTTALPLSSSQPINYSHNSLPSTIQNLSSPLFSSSTSSSTASEEEVEGSRKRKRSWKEFFQGLTKDVLRKQEELQRRFLETIDKHDQERMVREEAWKIQEMARINREHNILIQERSAAAAKDAAVLAFLQKISGQQAPQIQENPKPLLKPSPPQPLPPSAAPLVPLTNLNAPKKDNGDGNTVLSSSSRWPRAEVQALIRLRTNLETKYQENGPKGPLWEEVSAGMQRLGYNRSSKKCKEKWENINKYFKKVKESNKKRPDDSKTCPYFHQLDALYKDKGNIEGSVNYDHAVNSISTMEPLMVRPERQWPLQKENQLETVPEDREREKIEENVEDTMEVEEEDDVETEEEDEGGGFGMVENKPETTGNAK